MRPRWLNRGAVGTLAVLALLLAMPSQSAAYCEPLRAPWVERQLRELPKIRGLADSRLTVGKRLVIRQWGASSGLVVDGGAVGYDFSPRFGRLTLGWRVGMLLVRLKPGGGRGEEAVAFRRGRVGTVKAGGLVQVYGVRVPDEQGLFRFDFFIRNRRGKFLGKISRYLVGADPVYDVRMDTDRAVYSPGDFVLSEVENIGTRGISFKSFVRLQRQVGGQWVTVGGGAPLTTGGEGLEGGQIGGCAGAELPKDAPPGLYRATRKFGLVYTDEEDYDIPLTAPFRVE